MNNLHTLVFQHSFDGLCIFDKDGMGLDINKAAEKTTGFSHKEFVGETVENALEKGILSESITEIVRKVQQTVTKVISVKDVELLMTGKPIFEAGKLAYIVVNVRDISQLNNLKMGEILSIALKQKGNQSSTYSPVLISNGIIASSAKMKKTVHIANKIANVNSPVLILGETGVGKELIAKLIHENSNRAKKPLIKVNCAAIPEDLIESELFGYEKGAFTGANPEGKPGVFEDADGGTIFLDEIGEMPLHLQVKLLRVLQEYEVKRVGGRKDIKVDTRIISATNKKLDESVQKGEFREDLYYRLNIIPLEIPPLRERTEDIKPLAHMMLNRTNEKYHLYKTFKPGVAELLEMHSWPGNIREMENMIERLVVTAETDEIAWSDLPFISEQTESLEHYSLKKALNEIEKRIIMEKSDIYKTTREVAKALGISQSSVVKKVKKYQL